MTRQQLAHLLRRACAVVGDVDVLVLGSQSILGSFDENELPPQATASQEADIAFVNDPARDKADHVDVAIGEMSDFHRSNGVYAEGVHIDTAILPNGWRDRLVSWTVESSRPAKPRFWNRTTSRWRNLPPDARRTKLSWPPSSEAACSTWV